MAFNVFVLFISNTTKSICLKRSNHSMFVPFLRVQMYCLFCTYERGITPKGIQSKPNIYKQKQIGIVNLRVDNLKHVTTKRLNKTFERFPGSHEQTLLTRLQSLDHMNSFDCRRPFAAFLPAFKAMETFQVSEIIELIKR